MPALHLLHRAPHSQPPPHIPCLSYTLLHRHKDLRAALVHFPLIIAVPTPSLLFPCYLNPRLRSLYLCNSNPWSSCLVPQTSRLITQTSCHGLSVCYHRPVNCYHRPVNGYHRPAREFHTPGGETCDAVSDNNAKKGIRWAKALLCINCLIHPDAQPLKASKSLAPVTCPFVPVLPNPTPLPGFSCSSSHALCLLPTVC